MTASKAVVEAAVAAVLAVKVAVVVTAVLRDVIVVSVGQLNEYVITMVEQAVPAVLVDKEVMVMDINGTVQSG